MYFETSGPGIIIGAICVIGVLLSLYTIEQAEQAVIERFGKFVRVAYPGLNLRIPLIEKVIRRDMRIQTLDMVVETKTKDNVFVKVKVSLQYQISDINKAIYRLANVQGQLTSFINDVVRAKVPAMNLDDVFAEKETVAQAIKDQLSTEMGDFGFQIVKSLITDVDPAQEVKDSMNAINAAQRERVAATERGEADKILMVKKAEAEAESKKLQGQGIADQRAAIIHGLKKSVEEMKDATGSSAQDVMSLILTTQYFDTLKSLGEHSNANTILLPHNPGSVGDIQTQLMTALSATNGHGAKKTVKTNGHDVAN